MNKKSSVGNLVKNQKFIVILVFIALFIVFTVASPVFLKYTTIIQMFDMAYYYVLMAFGVGLALITGGVDLSIGTGVVCYAIVGAAVIKNLKAPVLVGILIAILLAVGIGLFNGILIAVMQLPPFLATLCTCMIARGLGSICANNFSIPWPTVSQAGGEFHFLFKFTAPNGMIIPIGFIWIFVLMLIMRYVLNSTKFGRYTIGIGSNKEALLLSGVNTRFYHIMVYVVCGLFAGVASIAYAASTPTIQPGVGAGMEMDAIGGAIVGGVSASGGRGTMEGIFIGTFVIMLLKVGLPFVGFQANWQQLITGFVLNASVMLDVIKKSRAQAAKAAA